MSVNKLVNDGLNAIKTIEEIKAVLKTYDDDWTKFDRIETIVNEYDSKPNGE